MIRRDGDGDRDTASLRSVLVADSPFAGLHVLADDDERWGRDPVSQARDACAGGAHVIQLRVKHASDGQALEWALAMDSRLCGVAVGLLVRIRSRPGQAKRFFARTLTDSAGSDSSRRAVTRRHPRTRPPEQRRRVDLPLER